MLKKHLGMRWYKILSVLLIIWSIFEPLRFLGNWTYLANSAGQPFFDFLVSTSPYSFVWLIGTIVDSILMLILRSDMHAEDPNAIKATRNILIFSALFSALAIASGISLLQSLDVSSSSAFSDLSIFLNKLIIFLPTYFYLKKRFYAVSNTSHADMTPESVIPVRLLGVSDQAQRDHIISEYMGQIVNPYTGNLVTSEAEWNIYLHGLPESIPHSGEELISKPISELTAKVEPDSTESESKEPAPILKFCRFCGKPIKSDSKFCEYCGKSI